MNFKLWGGLLLALLIGSGLKAQEIENNDRMVKAFKADGFSNEWNEPLNQYNTDTKLAFGLANDDKNLYIIIESLDPQTTFRILKEGITLNINTEGKKKKGATLIFPLIEKVAQTEENKATQPEHENRGNGDEHDFSNMTKGIKISGFKNINDGDLPLDNSYGIEAGMNVKPNRDLIY